MDSFELKHMRLRLRYYNGTMKMMDKYELHFRTIDVCKKNDNDEAQGYFDENLIHCYKISLIIHKEQNMGGKTTKFDCSFANNFQLQMFSRYHVS